MEFSEISENAYYRKGLGNFKNIAEKYAYVQMENLYMDYKNENITKEQANKEKIKIQKEYELNLNKVKEYYDFFKNQNEAKKQYEQLLYSIEKSSSQDDLLINSLKLIEILINDNNFFDRNYKKVKEVDNL